MNTFIDVSESNMPKDIINNIRNRLFEIKTNHGMIPYSSVRNFLLNNPNIYDIYTNEPKILKKKYLYNIEHAVLSSIISIRPMGEDKEKKIYINNEPYHDPHILFPTLKVINFLRSNYIFGDIEEKGFKMEKIIDKTTIDNIKNKNYIEENKLQIQSITMPDDFNIYDSIIIDDNCKVKKKNKTTGKDYYNCELGECIFEPKNITSGTIARIVFYYFLMYAYDPTKRPYTSTEPWLVYDKNTNNGKNICYGLKADEWIKFFYDNFNYYYYSAKNNPITDLETNRNKEIINLTGVPNIFVGYYNDEGIYVTSSFDFIDEFMGFIPPSKLNNVLKCKKEGIKTNKTYGSTVKFHTVKYLIKNDEIDRVTCDNPNFYKIIISSQVETLKSIKVYKTNDNYKNIFENIFVFVNKIKELCKDFTEKNFNKFANLEITKLNKINSKMNLITESITKKLKSISEQKIIASELKTIFIDANNKLNDFHNFITKKIAENSENTVALEKFNKILKDCQKIQTIEKKKIYTGLNKIINNIAETDIKSKIEHTCIHTKYHEKYLKYKNKYLALKMANTYF